MNIFLVLFFIFVNATDLDNPKTIMDGTEDSHELKIAKLIQSLEGIFDEMIANVKKTEEEIFLSHVEEQRKFSDENDNDENLLVIPRRDRSPTKTEEKLDETKGACKEIKKLFDEVFDTEFGQNKDLDEKLAKKCFGKLKNEASYEAIVTFMQVATEYKKDRWNLKKLFNLRPEVTIVNSLTHQFLRPGEEHYRNEKAKGLQAFRVYTRKKGTMPLICPEYDFSNGSFATYYDASESTYRIQHHLKSFYRSLGAFFVQTVFLKAFLDPNDFGYTLKSMLNFPVGQIAAFQLMNIAVHGMWLLSKIMTSDQEKPIMPHKIQNWLVWIWRGLKTFVHDFLLTCLVVAGTLAAFVVKISPINHEYLMPMQPKRLMLAILATLTLIGYVFVFATIAFAIAETEIKGEYGDGFLATFKKECGNKPFVGYFDIFPCWESLTATVSLYWSADNLEGWNNKVWPATNLGGMVWFNPGLLLKIMKILLIEPLLEFNGYVTRALFEKIAHSECSESLKLKKYSPRNAKIGRIFSGLSLMVIGLIIYGAMPVLGDLFAFAFAAVYGLQGVFYLSQLLPSNTYTHHIASGLGWVSIVTTFFSFGAYLHQYNSQFKLIGEASEFIPGGTNGVYRAPSVLAMGCFATAVQLLSTGAIVTGVLKYFGLLWYRIDQQFDPTYKHMQSMSARVLKIFYGETAENLIPSYRGIFYTSIGFISFILFWALKFSPFGMGDN